MPTPEVYVTNQPGDGLYPGNEITLICTVVLGDHVNNHENVTVKWHETTNVRYTIASLRKKEEGNAYTSNLTISPLTEDDAGQFVCTGIVTGVNTAKNSSQILIEPEGKILL